MAFKNNPREHQDTIFATILADGKIHVGVEEGTEGAVEREIMDKKNPKKVVGTKTEMIYTEMTGKIEKVDFYEGKYGINLQIVMSDDEDEKPTTLSIPVNTNFAEDLMKKLPAINLKKPVTFAPYSFENDKGKSQRGVTVTQLDKKGEPEKILSFYVDEDKNPINGFPAIPKTKAGKKLGTSDWRKYFDTVREFLIEDITDRFEIDKDHTKTQADKDFDNA